jgi:hypothetical protein
MKRAADKLIGIADGRPGTKGKAKPKSKPTTKRTSATKPAKPNDTTKRAKRSARATKTPEPVPRPLTDTQKAVVQLIHNGHCVPSSGMAHFLHSIWPT